MTQWHVQIRLTRSPLRGQCRSCSVPALVAERIGFPFNLVRYADREAPQARRGTLSGFGGRGQATPAGAGAARAVYFISSWVTKTYPRTPERATTRIICKTMQIPGISLQALPKVQLNNDFTHTSQSTYMSFVFLLQLSVFKLETANFVCLELTDSGTHPGTLQDCDGRHLAELLNLDQAPVLDAFECPRQWSSQAPSVGQGLAPASTAGQRFDGVFAGLCACSKLPDHRLDRARMQVNGRRSGFVPWSGNPVKYSAPRFAGDHRCAQIAPWAGRFRARGYMAPTVPEIFWRCATASIA